jgi:hypothetical protein
LDLAVSDYTKAIELNPKDASAYNNRGIPHFSRLLPSKIPEPLRHRDLSQAIASTQKQQCVI